MPQHAEKHGNLGQNNAPQVALGRAVSIPAVLCLLGASTDER